MATKWYSTEKINFKLHKVEVVLAKVMSISQVYKQIDRIFEEPVGS